MSESGPFKQCHACQINNPLKPKHIKQYCNALILITQSSVRQQKLMAGFQLKFNNIELRKVNSPRIVGTEKDEHRHPSYQNGRQSLVGSDIQRSKQSCKNAAAWTGCRRSEDSWCRTARTEHFDRNLGCKNEHSVSSVVAKVTKPDDLYVVGFVAVGIERKRANVQRCPTVEPVRKGWQSDET